MSSGSRTVLDDPNPACYCVQRHPRDFGTMLRNGSLRRNGPPPSWILFKLKHVTAGALGSIINETKATRRTFSDYSLVIARWRQQYSNGQSHFPTRAVIYAGWDKKRTFFRLDNFVTVSPRKACCMSKFSQFYREKRYKTRISVSLNILCQICSNRHNS